MSEPTEDPFESLRSAIAFSSADWSEARDLAWIYGIVLGWDPDPGEDEDGAMDVVAQRFSWDAANVARLRRLHAAFEQHAGMP
ncbi:hypothetical protein OG874_00215 [Nocardia sp. NBC_00565]|uniref:hypothetical protein n=1 Tax=Nocardia sp. NBC_00565 TaxID=2975993 RepID=UPI002E808CB3|nr:hypothetical protein [Nocardia sp. NBC_00565]WUC03678.1 hypothetical protein OG874_00215 [Nocardia sp. NBC_00565]